MFSPSANLRIVRAGAAYDLFVTWPFALPWTFVWLYTQLTALSLSLGLPGTFSNLDATHILFANLLGSVVIVWSLARLYAPSKQLGWLDGVARCLFACWQIYAYMHGAGAVILAFTVAELIFAVLQFWPVRKAAV